MQWADYSGGRPSGAALKASGFGGVIRYIGLGSEGKQLTAAEYRDLVASGVQVLLVAEANTADAWGTETDDDFARGAANARIALADARAQGVPDSVGIACAADAHAAAYQIDDVVRYARGFESVIGKGRTGFYGFQETLTAIRSAGIGSWYWRCGSEPTTDEKTWIHFWQRNSGQTQRTVSGVRCDVNEQYLPIPNAQEEDDMPSAKEVAEAVWNEALQNALDPAWTAARDIVRFGHMEAGKGRRELNAKIDTLLARSGGATADEVAAKLLPALVSATAAAVANLDVSQLDKISDEDAEQIAKAVTDRAAGLLGGTS